MKTLRGNLLRIKIFIIFQTFWGMGGTGNFDRQGVVQIGKPIGIKEMGRCRSAVITKFFSIYPDIGNEVYPNRYKVVEHRVF